MTLPTCACFASKVEYIIEGKDYPEMSAEEQAAFTPVPVYGACTAHVSKGRTFAPGHDAKLKSVLIRAFRAGTEYARLDGGILIQADPMEVAKERGWERFLKPAKARKARKSTKASKAEDKGQTEPDSDQPVQGFRPCQVKVGRWWKDGQVVAYPSEGEITVTYKDSKGDAKTITVEAAKVREG